MMNNNQAQDSSTFYLERGRRRLKAVVVDNFRVMYQPGSALAKVKAQLSQRGLHIYETPHFLFTSTSTKDSVILIHTFSSAEIDNNVGYYLMQELAPYGLLQSEQAFGAAFIGIVTSILPNDPISAWGTFSLNTLRRLQERLSGTLPVTGGKNFITSFATIYRRLLSLKVGISLLDVGCACAFWPVLVAQQEDNKQRRIVGVDNRPDAINLSTHLASVAKIDSIEFALADVLSLEFSKLGIFDTVTAIHLLEHLPQAQTPCALSNLLSVTGQRLLIAVPYEDQPETAYGHEQVFNRKKLEAWGKWCKDRLNGRANVYCEDVEGGLLVIERVTTD